MAVIILNIIVLLILRCHFQLDSTMDSSPLLRTTFRKFNAHSLISVYLSSCGCLGQWSVSEGDRIQSSRPLAPLLLSLFLSPMFWCVFINNDLYFGSCYNPHFKLFIVLKQLVSLISPHVACDSRMNMDTWTINKTRMG